jgi:hypothetical protein
VAKKDIRVVKPTPAEQILIDKALMKQYPQMYEPGWGNAKHMKIFAKAIKKKRQDVKKQRNLKRYSSRDADVEARLKHAGLSESEIAKLSRKK